jgi:hypothetical protein
MEEFRGWVFLEGCIDGIGFLEGCIDKIGF